METHCRHCGGSLYGIGLRTNRKFCSDICRTTYWEEHAEDIKRKAVYHLLCANCGKAFQTFAHEQKYCSVACYHEMRDVKKERTIQIIDEARCSQDERLRRKETLFLKTRGDSAARSEVLALRESGLSYQEIANKLEISRNTVKSWVRRQAEHPKKRETFYVVTDDKIIATCSPEIENEERVLDTVEVSVLTGIAQRRIFLICGPLVFQGKIDAFAARIPELLNYRLEAGDVFVFCSRNRRQISVLQWQGDGFVLMFRRTECERYPWPTFAVPKAVEITQPDLTLLMEYPRFLRRLSGLATPELLV